MANGYLRLFPWFADPDALVPCVLQIGITTTSALSEPSTAATATTHFASLFNRDTFGACQADCRRLVCQCFDADILGEEKKKKRKKRKKENPCLV